MAKTLQLSFHGAAATVTGSCLEFAYDDHRILVDCGLFQGSRSLETLNRTDFAFDPMTIDAVILTHAHIDHSGLLPRLVAMGYDKPIWCTPPTRDLLEVMLADAGRIQESDAERRNRRRDRADQPPISPLYTEADALAAWRLARPVALGERFEPAPGFAAQLWNAGHILGAASVAVEAGGVTTLCSGDIGPANKAFEPDPHAPSGFDHLICESTYGDRCRETISIAARRDLLAHEISTALARGGNLIIPVFALERTQELLLDIASLLDAGRIANIPVFVDSPLANRATQVFAKYASELEDMGGGAVFDHPAIHYVNDVADSIRLNQISGAIILAASGMCEGGRIRHHLKHNLFRREATVLFVGFQAQGSLGRVILDGAGRVRISGEDVVVRAQIRRIDSYSAHADQADLLKWIAARRPIAGSVFLNHGESSAIAALAELVRAQAPAAPGAALIKPEIGETYELAPAAPARRLKAGRTDLGAILGRDWQNSYADFATSLKQELAAIDSAEQRQAAIAEMRKVLDSYRLARAQRAAHKTG